MSILYLVLVITLVCGAPDAGPCQTGRHAPGTCPYDPTRGLCEEEGDCAPGLVCCDDGCGTICKNMTATPTKPAPTKITPSAVPTPITGICPTPTGLSAICLYFTSKGACLQHTDCPNGQLCCTEGCGKVCKTPVNPPPPPPPPKPVTIEKGHCPYLPHYYQCNTPFTYGCRGDYDCDSNSKCCRQPCSYSCRRVHISKSGECPVPPFVSARQCNYVSRCRDDGDCYGSAKCCDHPCGKQCVDSVAIKPGSCAAPANPASVYCIASADNCHQDNDCPATKKCCRHPCGNQCQDPVVPPKPGVCAPKPKGYRCLRWQNDCKLDMDCPGNYKCCATACGVGCVRPSFYLYST